MSRCRPRQYIYKDLNSLASMASPESPSRRSGRLLLSSPPKPATSHGAEVDSSVAVAAQDGASNGCRSSLAVQELDCHSCQPQEDGCLEQEHTTGSSGSLIRLPADVVDSAAGFLVDEAVELLPENGHLPAADKTVTPAVQSIVDHAPCHCSLPPVSGVDVPSESVADLLEVYSFLRSFSQILFLSPFPLPEFVCSLCLKEANALIDAVHTSLLQILRRHLYRISKEGSHTAFVCLRFVNPSVLSHVRLSRPFRTRQQEPLDGEF